MKPSDSDGSIPVGDEQGDGCTVITRRDVGLDCDTPRTDAEYTLHGMLDWAPDPPTEYIPKAHADRLERELAAMTAAKDKAVEALKVEHRAWGENTEALGFGYDNSNHEGCEICLLIAELEEVK